jgi:hypothetical protein
MSSLKDRIAMFNKKPEEATRRPSVVQRMGATKVDETSEAPVLVTPEKHTQTTSNVQVDTDAASVATTPSSSAKPSRRLSISERIASLKNTEASTVTPASPAESNEENLAVSKSDLPRKTLITDRIAAMKNTPIHKPSEADKYLSPNNKTSSDSSEPRSPPALPMRLMPDLTEENVAEVSKPQQTISKSMSISERIAAMKANATSKSETEILGSPATAPPQKPNNVKELGAKIILPGMGGPRPIFKPPPPPPSQETETPLKKAALSVEENGEFHHVSDFLECEKCGLAFNIFFNSWLFLVPPFLAIKGKHHPLECVRTGRTPWIPMNLLSLL